MKRKINTDWVLDVLYVLFLTLMLLIILFFIFVLVGMGTFVIDYMNGLEYIGG